MQTSLPWAAQIVSITEENAWVRTLVFDLSLEAEPGQFVMAWLPGVDEKPFSLARAEPVTLTIARLGRFTTAVHALAPGDRLWLRGPLGRGFTLPPSSPGDGPRAGGKRAGVLVVGGGYGVVPLHFLAERVLAAGWAVSAVVGARTVADLLYAGRFAALGAQVTVTTDDGSAGERGLATDAAERRLDEELCQALYACGPEPMLEAAERLARARGLAAQLSYERYMRCGFGVCGSCTRQGWLVCRDGPVKNVHAAQNSAIMAPT